VRAELVGSQNEGEVVGQAGELRVQREPTTGFAGLDMLKPSIQPDHHQRRLYVSKHHDGKSKYPQSIMQCIPLITSSTWRENERSHT
jgi:hypothetical protein